MASTSPWFMASTRSDTLETRLMSCSTISTVMPSSCLMSWIQNAMSSVSSTLRPEEGSSSSSSLGSVQSARQLHHLAHAVRQASHHRIAVVLQVEQFDHLLRLLARLDLGGP